MPKPKPTFGLRKPPVAAVAAPPLADVDTFVNPERGRAVVSVAPPPLAAAAVVPAAAPQAEIEIHQVARRRAVVTRKDGRRLCRTTVYFPPELARQLAVHSAQTGRQQSELVEEALRRYLGS